MQIPATTHGTVDQEVSICGPEKNLEGFKQALTRSTSLVLTGRQITDGTGPCCLGGRLGHTRYLEYHTDFLQREPIHGLVALARE